MKKIAIYILLLIVACDKKSVKSPYIIVLGTTQDGGAPQAGCVKKCCVNRWGASKKEFFVTSLGIIDPNSKEAWMIEATPDFAQQHKIIAEKNEVMGIFISHAHIGHYSGIMYLGRETMGYKNMPLHVGPKMKKFIKTNAPWNQLVELNNVKLLTIKDGDSIELNNRLTIKPFTVPHRDEFSETNGFQILGPNKSLIFIPDIDKWEKWDVNVLNKIIQNDFALLDGTFFDEKELPGRDMSEIPHPFVIESTEFFKKIRDDVDINFIHFNHTNPLLNENSESRGDLKAKGFNAASLFQRFNL